MEKGGVDHSVGGKASPDYRQDPTRLRKEALARIHKLHRKFTAELLSVALFLLLSIAALYDFASFFSLPENIRALLEVILRAKPPTSKGIYFRSIALSTTMGPGIKIDPLYVRNVLKA